MIDLTVQNNNTQNQTTNSASASSANAQQPLLGFNPPPFMQMESPEKRNAGMITNNNHILIENPFTPPPIDDKFITKIIRDEYVPLEEFLPSVAPTVFSQEEHSINLNYDNAALSIEPKTRRGKILNLSHWMVAWNAFFQAKLCYKPSMVYELCKYQEIFCDFASRFKFEACYKYDISCRRKIAAERTIAPEKRTIKWTMVSRENENRHLTRSAMLPVCDSCQVTGHIEKFCPVKKKNPNSSQQQNNSRDRSPLREHDQNDPNFDIESREQTRFRNDSRSASSSRSSRSSSNQNIPCHRYNTGIYCYKPACNNPHVCNVCTGNHPGSRCHDNTSSRFRPQKY